MRYLQLATILLLLAFASCKKNVVAGGTGGTGVTDSSGGKAPDSLPFQVFTGHADLSYILKGDSLFVAGWNAYGQLGTGNNNNADSFILSTTGVSSVSAGYTHALILKKDGTAWATGDNAIGQLGTGNTTQSASWVQVMTGVRSISAGNGTSFFVKTDNTLWGVANDLPWGLPDGITPDYTPHQLMDSVLAVCAGDSAVMIITTDSSLWAVGYDYDGQLGDGKLGPKTSNNEVAPIPIMTGVAAVSMNDFTAYILKTDQTLYTCGSNGVGQLGNGSQNNGAPQLVLSGVRSVSAGYGCAMAIKTDSTVWATGLDNEGQLGDSLGGPGGSVFYVTSFKQVFTGAASGALSQSSILIVRGDNSIWATGENFLNNLGPGFPIAVLTFTQLPTKF